jgi:NAD(P)-dependent dehydrogenase (short-subunit alcohol dehydrogenase family)
MGRIDNKVAVVTGGALGIGRATCLRLAEEGAAVAVTDVLEEEGQETVRQINDAGGTARFWRLDVSDETEAQSVFEAIDDQFGGIDILVNNAGISGADKPTDELSRTSGTRC